MSNSFSSGIRFNSSVLIGIVLLLVVVSFGLCVTEADAQQEVAAPEEKMVSVLVPLQDIPQGTELQPSMFKRIQKPESQVDERTIREFEGIVNMYSRTTLIANSPVLRDFVSNVKPINIIPPGYRAVTVRVDEEFFAEGLPKAGSKVDVNWISTVNGKRCFTSIVQCARFILVEGDPVIFDKAYRRPTPRTITLLVTAADAKKIQLAQAGQGQLSLDLRGDDAACIVDNKKGTYCEGDQNVDVDKPKACINIVIVDGRKWCADRGKLIPLTEEGK